MIKTCDKLEIRNFFNLIRDTYEKFTGIIIPSVKH